MDKIEDLQETQTLGLRTAFLVMVVAITLLLCRKSSAILINTSLKSVEKVTSKNSKMAKDQAEGRSKLNFKITPTTILAIFQIRSSIKFNCKSNKLKLGVPHYLQEFKVVRE